MRGQVNVVDEAQLWSPICSTFEALVVWHAVRHGCGEALALCWPILVAGVAVFDASHRFAEHTSQMYWFHWDSESCSGSDRQQTTKQSPWHLWWQVWLWEVLWSFFSVQPLAGLCRLLYKIHFSGHIKIWSRNGSLLLHRIERRTLPNEDFILFYFIVIQLMRHPLTELFHLSNLLQIPNNDRMVDTEFFWQLLCSFKRISLDDGLNCHCQLRMAGHDTPRLQVSCLLCKKAFNHPCSVYSLAILGPNVLLMLQIVSTALQHILSSNKKIVRICLLSNIISIV